LQHNNKNLKFTFKVILDYLKILKSMPVPRFHLFHNIAELCVYNKKNVWGLFSCVGMMAGPTDK